jgi:hypothetical protein
MRRHRHLTLHEQQRLISESIAWQGFALCHVLASAHEPAYSYTVGLARPDAQRPELVISGLATELRVAWLLDLGFRMQGPPPLATRRRIAQDLDLARDALRFPPGGEVFEPGKRYLDLAAHGLPTCFARLDPACYHTHLGQAVVFHGSCACDRRPRGFFPWEASFDRRFAGMQRLLFDPSSLGQASADGGGEERQF